MVCVGKNEGRWEDVGVIVLVTIIVSFLSSPLLPFVLVVVLCGVFVGRDEGKWSDGDVDGAGYHCRVIFIITTIYGRGEVAV